VSAVFPNANIPALRLLLIGTCTFHGLCTYLLPPRFRIYFEKL